MYPSACCHSEHMLCHFERSEKSIVGAQFIAPRNQGVINHAPTEERFLPSVEMTVIAVLLKIFNRTSDKIGEIKDERT
ncbi:MAG: hypothetical protein ABII25_00535 [bacterium]